MLSISVSLVLFFKKERSELEKLSQRKLAFLQHILERRFIVKPGFPRLNLPKIATVFSAKKENTVLLLI